MPERVTTRFLLDAGLVEVFGDQLPHAAPGNRLVLVVEKEMVIRGIGPDSQIILDRLGDFAFQFNASSDHAFAGTNIQDTLGEVDIVTFQGDQLRDAETGLKEDLQDCVIAWVAAW